MLVNRFALLEMWEDKVFNKNPVIRLFMSGMLFRKNAHLDVVISRGMEIKQ